MKKFGIPALMLLFLTLGVSGGAAATVDLYDWAFNIDGTVTAAPDEYVITGMPVTGTLDSNDLGTLAWTTSAVGSHSFIAFFDYEIDEAINTFSNEYGEAVSTPAATQSWEIDEPGYLLGDIYDHVLAGSLDNNNTVPGAIPDDVSWAIGWDFVLAVDHTATISLVLAGSAPASGFYLSQTDPDSNETIYYSSNLTIAPVPLPGTMVLLGTGLAALFGLGRKKFKK